MKYTAINPALFIDNRNRFVKHLLPNSVAIFNSNDVMPTNAVVREILHVRVEWEL